MVIRSIRIRNLGGIRSFEWDFADNLNIIKTGYAKEIAYALQIITNHSVCSLSDHRVGADTEITASILISDRLYWISIKPDPIKKHLYKRVLDENRNDIAKEYQYLTAHCPEQDMAEVFSSDTKQALYRLIQYMNRERTYSPKELSHRTDRLSETKIFRSYLKKFILDFSPEPLFLGKPYELVLDPSGRYRVRYTYNDALPVYLSETEQRIFHYLCFLITVEFWYGFEKMRNLHSIQKPLVILDFLERLDEAFDVQSLLERTMKLKRQIMILTI